MPFLAFFVMAGWVLVALLFVADATLEKNDSPVIVTSQRTGLPTPRYHNANATKALTTPAAPEPDMKSQAVLAAQPKSVDALPKISPRPVRRGLKRHSTGRNPKTIASGSRSTTNSLICSTDFLLRAIRAGIPS